ncbi:MAG: hypothetical protein ABW168_01370 [Sedimenticola sp.]
MDHVDAYELAIKRILDLSTKDATSAIARENAALGLKRIIWAYNLVGNKNPDVSLVALPDFTITRNALRWQAGFSYGCVLQLDSGVDPLIPVNFRPNACGVALAKIGEESENYDTIIQRFRKTIEKHDAISSDDFNRRNHFLALLRNDDAYYVLLHGSFGFIKKDTRYGPGLYSEQTDFWKEKYRRLGPPGQEDYFLVGEDAEKYHETYLQHESLTMEIREKVILDVFPEAEFVFHSTHEGFAGINTLLLGAYVERTPFEFPLMVAPDKNIPMITNNKSLRELTNDQWSIDLYAAPHGAGYAIDDVATATTSACGLDDTYELQYENGATMYCRGIQNTMLSYRKETEEFWCERIGAGNKTFDMSPLMFAKV